MSLQITGWPGLNDRKNYVATDEESPEVLISVIRAIFARIKKKKKEKRLRERGKKKNCQMHLIRCPLYIYIYKRGQKFLFLQNNRTPCNKTWRSSIDINAVVATIKYDRENAITAPSNKTAKRRILSSIFPFASYWREIIRDKERQRGGMSLTPSA